MANSQDYEVVRIDVVFNQDFPLNPPCGGRHKIDKGTYTLINDNGDNSGDFAVHPHNEPHGVILARVGVKVVCKDGKYVAEIS